jgi:hypothetical protein
LAMTHKPRRRRTKAEMSRIGHRLTEIVQRDAPTTCRSVFYQAVSEGLIEKTERQYKGTVIRLLGQLRREGAIPFCSITDGTRLRRQPLTHDSLEDALWYTKQTYRRALWNEQDAYVEVWSEKEAIAGVLHRVTNQWDVPLLVCRGYPSLTYLHSAAEEIDAQDKPAYLYYFGDHDPSGVDISRKVEEELNNFAPDAEIYFERVAVTREQIETLNLPTRPTKQSDSRAKGFVGESVEVDAIPTDELRRLTEECISQHLDPGVLAKTRRIEEAEKETLANLIRGAA